MQRLLTTTVLAATLVAAACGGKGSAPTAPSNEGTNAAAPSGPATPGSATITGRVQSAGSGATVAVAGTQASTGLDAAGNFTLRNVTPGDVQLRVSSAGANAMVALAGVQAAQTVEIVVSLSGASANLESEVRHGAGEAELKGIVDALPPSTPALTFKAAGKTVVTNASTVFVNGSATRSFADLKIGTRVEAKGSFAGDTLTATRVEIEDHAGVPNPGPTPAPAPTPKPEAELSGAISALTGSASSFQFNIGSRVVKGDATTAILGDSNTAKTFADLKNGAEVEVKGVQQTGFVQASRIKLEDEDEAEPENENDEVEVEGTLGTVSGTCPAISSTVNTTKFTASASTRFDNPCAGFKSGDKVEVKGSKNADGSIAATRLRKK